MNSNIVLRATATTSNQSALGADLKSPLASIQGPTVMCSSTRTDTEMRLSLSHCGPFFARVRATSNFQVNS
jgi:hypothetical protein